MSPIDADHLVTLLKQFTQEEETSLEIILIGGMALHYYGNKKRVTVDVDAEVKGDLEGLFHFLKKHHIPSDLSENISGWSVISMPADYQKRARVVFEESWLKIKILSPLDFIIAKLRRFSDEDIDDGLFVARKYKIEPEQVDKAAKTALENSIKDTALFLFKKNVQEFIKILKKNE